MRARVRKRMHGKAKYFVVEIKHGYKKFQLSYESEDKERAIWYRDQFNSALKNHVSSKS